MHVKNSFAVHVTLPFLAGSVAAIALHSFLDTRYLEAVIREGGSAADPATVWTLFGLRAVLVFALSLVPPLMAGTASRQVALSFAAGVALTYAIVAAIPLANLWPFSVVAAIVVAGGPALAGGLLSHRLKNRVR